MKVISILIMGVMFALSVNAQSYDLQYIIKKVNTQTDLNDAQRMQILSLSSTYYPKAMEINNSKSSDEIKLGKALALKKQLDGDLKDILSASQFKEYQKMCDDYETKHIKNKKGSKSCSK